MPTFTPLDDQVLIRRSPPKETATASGLVLPGTAQERPLQGEVLAVGPGRWLEHRGERLVCSVRVGDQVLFRKYGGTDVAFDGAECLVVRESEILGVIGEAQPEQRVTLAERGLVIGQATSDDPGGR